MLAYDAYRMQPIYSVNYRQPYAYPRSKYEAQLCWERKRQQRRAWISTLPSWSYLRTEFDQDERFFAGFPGARQATIDAWIAREYPDEPWAPRYQEYPTVYFYYDDPEPQDTHTPIHPPILPDYSKFSLMQALTYPTPETVPEIVPACAPMASPELALHYDYTGSYPGIDRPESIHGEDVPDLQHSLNSLEASHGCQSPPATSPTHRSALLFNTPPCSPPSSPRSLLPSPIIPPSCSFTLPQYTGNWEADAIAAGKALRSSNNNPVVERPLTSIFLPLDKPVVNPTNRRHHLTYRKKRPAPRSRPHSSPKLKNPELPKKPMTPAASRYQQPLRTKDGKPILACYFCRGRKIACGPPTKGDGDTSCNQCTRRGLQCVYPTENRRGQRKKKNLDSVTASSRKPSTSRQHDSDVLNDLLTMDDLEAESETEL